MVRNGNLGRNMTRPPPTRVPKCLFLHFQGDRFNYRLPLKPDFGPTWEATSYELGVRVATRMLLVETP